MLSKLVVGCLLDPSLVQITYYPNLMTAAPPGAGVLLNKSHYYIGRYFASLPMCLILY